MAEIQLNRTHCLIGSTTDGYRLNQECCKVGGWWSLGVVIDDMGHNN